MLVTTSTILTDAHQRNHNYLRISLTEKCNLRCNYCMPLEGVTLSPKVAIMTAQEVIDIASLFVKHGVTKIRLTGGEPFVRKDFKDIIIGLQQLGVELAITTNGILLDRHWKQLQNIGVTNITVSLDTLKRERFLSITHRNQFDKVIRNIKLLQNTLSIVKINVVLIKGVNDDEIIDFVALTQYENVKIRFIEFMPFDGNRWDRSKLVSQADILEKVSLHFSQNLLKLEDQSNDTSRNYQLENFCGSFAIISSVTNPFCDSCNRIRLTANGKIKNCLFSNNETDLLTSWRNDGPIESLIAKAIQAKHQYRAGMNDMEQLSDPKLHLNNRSMITIGG